MFGPALLVAPITSTTAQPLSVSTSSAAMYDYWSGIARGFAASCCCPYDQIPVFVRAVISLQPDMQYIGGPPITLCVYAEPTAVHAV